MKTKVCLAFAVLSATGICGAQTAQQKAQDILSKTGAKGGFVVHVGCGDGRLTAALRAGGQYVVQGLDTDADDVSEARRYIHSKDIYGPVSVRRFDGKNLPYVDNLVNLVVVEKLGQVPLDELTRVLAPGGAGIIAGQLIRKHRPEEMDDWTHYMYDAAGGSVCRDKLVGPPRRVQWVGLPRWARSHEHTASLQAMVSGGGRIFYVMDEGSRASIQLPSHYKLVARDAFNGTVLWKRPLPDWFNHMYPLKSGPAYMPRRLVAVGDKVYVSPGTGHNMLALDAATGEVLRQYPNTTTTTDIIVSDGVLFAVVDADLKKVTYSQQHPNCWKERDRASTRWSWKPKPSLIRAMDADSGKALWSKRMPVTPITLAVDEKGVHFFDGESLVCMDRHDGGVKWKTKMDWGVKPPIRTGYAPRLIVHGDYVIFSPQKRIFALSKDTGTILWNVKGKPLSGHFSPEDLFVINGVVWAGGTANRKDGEYLTGYRLRDGEQVKKHEYDKNTFFMHQRCYPGRATDRYLIPSATGTEFVDLESGRWEIHHWVRGGCLYGMMPANGLLYSTPHACACYYQSKLNGFNALASGERKIKVEGDRLHKGPAYSEISNLRSQISDEGWPTYRCDNERSGHIKTSLPDRLNEAWKANVGDKLSPVTVADGKLFVSDVDRHTVYALDAGDGSVEWSFTADGRVDSPPTIYRGLVFFGCADGCVYALRAADGQLAWRFRAAPMDRQLMSEGQPESIWPLPGAVLIQDDVLYAIAGRSMFLDGGLRMVRLNPDTGELIGETVMDDKIPGTNRNLQELIDVKHMPVAIPDILTSDGKYVYMKSQVFDTSGKRTRIKPQRPDEQYGDEVHLFAPVGFLDDSWQHRTYWMYGRAGGEGWGEYQIPPRRVPFGRIICLDEDNAYAYGREPELMCNCSINEYRLYCANKKPQKPDHKLTRSSVDWKKLSKMDRKKLTALKYKWENPQPDIMVKAMVLAGDKLFVAGPPDVVDEKQMWGKSNEELFRRKMRSQEQALKGEMGAYVQVFSAKNGKKINQWKISSLPAWDGMAAANGRLYLATKNGEVICYGK